MRTELLRLGDARIAEAVGDRNQRGRCRCRAGRTAEHGTVRTQQVVILAVAAQIDPAVGLIRAVATHAMPIQNRLDQPFVPQQPIAAPGRRGRSLGRLQQGQRRPQLDRRRLALTFVTAAATSRLAMLQTDERAHPPQFHESFVQQLKINGRIGRHVERRRPVLMYRDRTDHPYRRPARITELFLVRRIGEVGRHAALGIQRPADVLRDAQITSRAARNPVEPFVHVRHVTDRLASLAVLRQFRQTVRHRAGRDGHRMDARQQHVAVDQFAVAVDIDQIDGQAVAVDAAQSRTLRPRVGVGHQEAVLGQRARGGVQTALVADAALSGRCSGHRSLLQPYAGCDHRNRLGRVHADARVDQHHRPVGERMMTGRDGDQFATARNGPRRTQGQRRFHVLLEQGV